MRNPEQTRLKLVATATQLLLSKGAEGLRVDEVAAVAGVNKRMIYHYFDNKEGLYRGVLHTKVCLLVDCADILSVGAKAFLVDHFALSADQKSRQTTITKEVDNVAGKALSKERGVHVSRESATNAQQNLQEAGLIVLRALLGQRQFNTRLNSYDWASLVQGLMALGLPQLSEVDQLAAITKNMSERTLTKKPRYTLQAQHRYSKQTSA